MESMKSLVFAFALLTTAAATPPEIDASVPPTTEVFGNQERHAEALLIRLREQYKLPALAAVVVRADTTLDLAVTGLRQQGNPELVELTDRFHLGSMGKAITATVIARLVEEGNPITAIDCNRRQTGHLHLHRTKASHPADRHCIACATDPAKA